MRARDDDAGVIARHPAELRGHFNYDFDYQVSLQPLKEEISKTDCTRCLMHYTNVRHFTIRWPRLAFHARDSLAEDNNREKYGAIRTRLSTFAAMRFTTDRDLYRLR